MSVALDMHKKPGPVVAVKDCFRLTASTILEWHQEIRH